MRNWLLLSLLLCGCDKATAPPTPPAAVPSAAPVSMPSDTSGIAAGNNAFAFDLWSKVGPKTPGNYTVSPASMSIAFAMVSSGAKGETGDQIKKSLHFDAGADESWGKVAKAVTGPDRAMKLRIANRLFGEKSYKFEEPFLERTKTTFAAPLELLDFKTDFEKGRAHINDWVDKQTEARIKDLLPQGALDKDTRLAVVNAIYFLADWATPFEKERTFDNEFAVKGGAATKRVPMMHMKEHLSFAKIEGGRALEMPYKRGEASMVVLLPEKKDGLPEFEKSLTAAKLDGFMKALRPVEVEVSFPRFEVAPPTAQLGPDLVSLGMPLAFDRDKADFTGIANPPSKADRLYIAKVFHKAFVKVDEKGTEAAAATAIVMAKGGGPPPPSGELFIADHPFLFFIVDKPSGIILFMGRVEDPSAK